MSTKQKGPGGSSHSHQDPNTRQGVNDKTDGSRYRSPRHVFGQLPIVLAATIYPPAYGMSQALIVPDDMCPGCSCWHSHRIKYPAPVLVLRKARCGTRYELALHTPKATRRGKRAA